MLPKPWFSILAICFNLLGSASYLCGVYQGHIRPHAISWLIWSIVMFVAFLGQLAEGSGPGCWPTGFGAMMALLILLLSARTGDREVSAFDWICLLLAAGAGAAFSASSAVLTSMALATGVDVIGYLPTIRKICAQPESEDLRPWLSYAIVPLFSLAAIESYNLETALYPCALGVMNVLMVGILLSARRRPRAMAISPKARKHSPDNPVDPVNASPKTASR